MATGQSRRCTGRTPESADALVQLWPQDLAQDQAEDTGEALGPPSSVPETSSVQFGLVWLGLPPSPPPTDRTVPGSATSALDGSTSVVLPRATF